MNRTRTARLLAALAGCAFPLVALAHAGSGTPHTHGALASLAAGFTHPFTGLDHLAAMVALGAWSAMTTRRMGLAPVAFASALLVGALLGATGLVLPAVEPMIAASLLVLGLLVATGRRLPTATGAALAALFALFHGVAHGTELIGAGATAAIAGMVVATALLHTAGIGLGLAWRGTNRWPARLAGTAVAVFGLALFA